VEGAGTMAPTGVGCHVACVREGRKGGEDGRRGAARPGVGETSFSRMLTGLPAASAAILKHVMRS